MMKELNPFRGEGQGAARRLAPPSEGEPSCGERARERKKHSNSSELQLTVCKLMK